MSILFRPASNSDRLNYNVVLVAINGDSKWRIRNMGVQGYHVEYKEGHRGAYKFVKTFSDMDDAKLFIEENAE